MKNYSYPQLSRKTGGVDMIRNKNSIIIIVVIIIKTVVTYQALVCIRHILY